VFGVLRTLGIDLAAQDKKTAYCAIEWDSGRAFVEAPLVGTASKSASAALQQRMAILTALEEAGCDWLRKNGNANRVVVGYLNATEQAHRLD
jgi:hypothetical protein